MKRRLGSFFKFNAFQTHNIFLTSPRSFIQQSPHQYVKGGGCDCKPSFLWVRLRLTQRWYAKENSNTQSSHHIVAWKGMKQTSQRKTKTTIREQVSHSGKNVESEKVQSQYFQKWPFWSENSNEGALLGFHFHCKVMAFSLSNWVKSSDRTQPFWFPWFS